MKTDKLNRYPLFVALTRKPMLFGVSQTYFIFILLISFCSTTLLMPYFGAAALLTAMTFFVVSYFLGWMGYKQDEHCFEIWLGQLEARSLNTVFHGCDGYDAE